MKRLVWKIKYSYLMWKTLRVSLSFLWESAEAAIDNNEDWLEDGVEYTLDEELNSLVQ